MLYVVDTEDSVQVNENGERSDRKLERDLLFTGQQFVDDMESKGIEIELIKGNLENETARIAEELNVSLVIVGREQKQKGMLGLPIKNIKKRLAEKCGHSILFLN
jgi:hypothetical protein